MTNFRIAIFEVPAVSMLAESATLIPESVITIALFFISLLFGAIGYFIVNFIFTPILRFRDLKARIQADLIYYSNIIENSLFQNLSEASRLDASRILRRDSAELSAANTSVQRCNCLRKPFKLPSPELAKEAASCLVDISNCVLEGRARNPEGEKVHLLEQIQKIQQNLGIEIDERIDERIKTAITTCHSK